MERGGSSDVGYGQAGCITLECGGISDVGHGQAGCITLELVL